MKIPFPLVLTAILWTLPKLGLTQAYKNEKILYLDARGNPVKEKRAVTIEQIIPLGDTVWEMNDYRMYGPRIRSYRCSDPEGRMLNGTYTTYSANGMIDTIGMYKNGQRSGYWIFFTGPERKKGTQYYAEGTLLSEQDFLQFKHKQDSAAALIKKDTVTVFQKVEVESDFVGGPAAWLKYLNHNLRYPDEEVDKNIQGQVIVVFIVDKTGVIQPNSISLDRSVDFGIDEEAIRVILSSANSWTPAMQNGRQVKSYKKQPINFGLTRR
jgi:hypothetical protein